MRSAEKERTSTCPFADRVATTAIAAFRRHAAAQGVTYKQTVMAAVVAVFKRDAGPAHFTTVALGAGTKFLRTEAVIADATGECVRDCHAEPLARSAFQRYLLLQLLGCMRGDASIFRLPATAGGRFRLAEGLSFHLYSSSQPCGNASIKRWAKPGTGEALPAMSEAEHPPARHNRLSAPKHARLEGMLALSVKREPRPGRGARGGGGRRAGGRRHALPPSPPRRLAAAFAAADRRARVPVASLASISSRRRRPRPRAGATPTRRRSPWRTAAAASRMRPRRWATSTRRRRRRGGPSRRARGPGGVRRRRPRGGAAVAAARAAARRLGVGRVGHRARALG